MWVTVFSSLHSSSFHRRRTIEYEGELCIRIPRFLRFTLSLPLLVPRPFILFSGRSFSGTTPRSRPFRRERSLNFPLPLLAFTSHRFRRSRLDASSSPRDVTYRSALVSNVYAVAPPKCHRSRPYPPFLGKTWKMALLTAKLFDCRRICSRIKVTFSVTANKCIFRNDVWLESWAN